jgi:hypothetical protein
MVTGWPPRVTSATGVGPEPDIAVIATRLGSLLRLLSDAVDDAKREEDVDEIFTKLVGMVTDLDALYPGHAPCDHLNIASVPSGAYDPDGRGGPAAAINLELGLPGELRALGQGSRRRPRSRDATWAMSSRAAALAATPPT